MNAEATKRASEEKVRSLLHMLRIETHQRVEFKDITNMLQKLVEESRIESGLCHVFAPHTTAAVLINENDDPSLQKDFDEFLKQLAPTGGNYHHNDGNCDAHLKAAVIGCTKTLLVENQRLILGRWQGVFFCEFDGPRQRELRVKIVPD
ncbi:MAG TPA: secondary thiamine-phosphate synthase enzyme YjbQ [Terriglobia bacterium]|nr:secondary thiamine-phosphate synthase enzyme YjbQ [Terriglobia bacterium]